jgi:leucyl aminopeptidase
VYKPPEEIYNARNLIIDLPGETHPEEMVVLSAHYDTLSTSLLAPAPGADDDSTGLASLLEAARIFSQYRFARTIRFIFFTGEEQIEIGSRAYLLDHPQSGIVGVINLDMFGYDANNDRCFEIHAGGLPASQELAQCVLDGIAAYQLDLRAEVFAATAIGDSDHSSFWAYHWPAILMVENVIAPQPQQNTCGPIDRNPYYHSANDKLEHINVTTAFAIARAGIAAAASLAMPLGRCSDATCAAPALQTPAALSPLPSVPRRYHDRPYLQMK